MTANQTAANQNAGTGKLGEVMQRDPVHVQATNTLREAIGVMSCRGIRHLLVVSPTGALHGIVSQRDIALHLARTGRNSRVAEVMASPVISTHPEMSVTEAARVMVEKKVGCLPVLSTAGQIVGIITRSDLLRVFSAAT